MHRNSVWTDHPVEKRTVVGTVSHLLRQRSGHRLQRKIDLLGDLSERRSTEDKISRWLDMGQLEGPTQNRLGRRLVEVMLGHRGRGRGSPRVGPVGALDGVGL